MYMLGWCAIKQADESYRLDIPMKKVIVYILDAKLVHVRSCTHMSSM